MAQPPDEIFPVPRQPPASWFWPKVDQKRRKEAQRLNAISRGLIRDYPHLSSPRHRARIKVAAIRLWILERALSALPEDPLSPETGEIRESYTTISRLASYAAQALAALDIVTPPTDGEGKTFDAVFARVEHVYRVRHGTKEIEDATND